MFQLIQDLLVIVFGLVLILILLVALRSVHRQSQRLKQLETKLSLNNPEQLNREEEENDGEKSILR